MKAAVVALPGVLIIEPEVHRDQRGWFMEAYRDERFAALGLPTVFPQDNISRSSRNVLRGLHYQLDRPQGKLVTCCEGEIYDIVVDIRRGSPTFGRWASIALTAAEPRQLWVPPGFAHGFCVLSDRATVHYKCTDRYDPGDDRGILWSDPRLGIPWPVSDPILSDRDRGHPTLEEAEPRLPVFAAGRP